MIICVSKTLFKGRNLNLLYHRCLSSLTYKHFHRFTAPSWHRMDPSLKTCSLCHAVIQMLDPSPQLRFRDWRLKGAEIAMTHLYICREIRLTNLEIYYGLSMPCKVFSVSRFESIPLTFSHFAEQAS